MESESILKLGRICFAEEIIAFYSKNQKILNPSRP